jgi:hypothetical protein
MDDTSVLFSEKEQHILKLYDRLQELRLEIALLKAQQNFKQSMDFPGYRTAPPIPLTVV